MNNDNPNCVGNSIKICLLPSNEKTFVALLCGRTVSDKNEWNIEKGTHDHHHYTVINILVSCSCGMNTSTILSSVKRQKLIFNEIFRFTNLLFFLCLLYVVVKILLPLYTVLSSTCPVFYKQNLLECRKNIKCYIFSVKMFYLKDRNVNMS